MAEISVYIYRIPAVKNENVIFKKVYEKLYAFIKNFYFFMGSYVCA